MLLNLIKKVKKETNANAITSPSNPFAKFEILPLIQL